MKTNRTTERFSSQTAAPLISVIIPVYQVEQYIRECLESVIRQTFPHFEIICVDDGGEDQSLSIVEEFAQRDDRIRILRNATSRGPSGSRNTGLKLCTAPFVMFLDSDDCYDATICEKMYHAIVSSNADIAACGTQISYESDSSLKESDDLYYALKYDGLHKVSDDIISSCDVSAWNKIFRRDFIDKYKIQFPEGMRYEDAYFFNAYMAHAKSIFFVNEKLYHYRRREGSIMNQTFAKASAMSRDHLTIAFLLHDYYSKWGLSEKKYTYFCKFFLQCLNFALWHSPSEQEQNIILSKASEFIGKKLNHTKGLDYQTSQRIEELRYLLPHQPRGILISLIIPVYQVERYIRECLESAVRQTFPHIEIICVDDKGTDLSMSIVEEFAQRDDRIRILRNATNRGLSGSRNAGLMHSSAPFIMFMDSDDYYDVTMCEKMYHAIVSSNADIAACGTQISYESDFSLKKSDDKYYALKFEGRHEVSDELISSCDVSAWNKIFRRDFIDKYGIQFPVGLKYEDSYFFNAYMAHAKSIFFVNEKLYHYRRREGSIMNQTFSQTAAISQDHLTIAFRLHEYFTQWKVSEEKYAYFCKYLLQCLDFALRRCPSEKEQDRLLLIAGDFARENLTSTENLDCITAQRMERLRNIRPHHTRGILFGIKTSPFSKSYSLLGLPLYQIKYSPSRQKHYFLGVKIYHKKHV